MTEIRNIRQEELLESIAMSEFAFQYELPPERREQVLADMRPERIWGSYVEGRLASKMTIHPFETWLHGVKIKMGGIAGVATWPEFRRKGLVSGLLKHGLQVMKEAGQIVSFLHPFSFSFYRKFGWETLTEYRKYELEAGQLPSYPIYAGSIRRDRDIRLLNAVYERFATQFSGMLVRDEVWWEKLLRDRKDQVAVYADAEGCAQGYIFYQVKDFVLTITEMIALNEEARRALWRFIADHDSMFKKVIVQKAPMDDSLPFMLQDPRITQEVVPYFMARIVDVHRLLERFPWVPRHERDGQSGVIRLYVQDEQAPWNDGMYEVRRTADGRQTAVVKLSSGPGENTVHTLTCDIGTLSTMLFGYKRPRFLFQIGRLQGSREQMEELERWIPATVTAFIDFF